MKNILNKGKWHKITIGTFFYVLMFVNSSSYCQQDSAKKMQFILKGDVFFPMVRVINAMMAPDDILQFESLTFETCFSKRQSIQLSGFIQTDGRAPIQFQIISEYKYFLGKRKPYCGPYLGICLKYIQDRPYEDIWSPNRHSAYEFYMGEDFIFGYQNLIGKHFAYDLLLGIGGKQLIYRTSYSKPDNHPLDGRLAINIGYKF